MHRRSRHQLPVATIHAYTFALQPRHDHVRESFAVPIHPAGFGRSSSLSVARSQSDARHSVPGNRRHFVADGTQFSMFKTSEGQPRYFAADAGILKEHHVCLPKDTPAQTVVDGSVRSAARCRQTECTPICHCPERCFANINRQPASLAI